MKLGHEASSAEINPLDKLLAKLNEHKGVISKQTQEMKNSDDTITSQMRTAQYVSACSTAPITPLEEHGIPSTAPTTRPPSIGEDLEDVQALKAELEAAHHRIARMEKEVAQTRITKHTIDQAIDNASEADFPFNHTIGDRHNLLQPTARPPLHRDNSWATQDDSRSDTSEALSAGGFNRARAIWGNGPRPGFPTMSGPIPPFHQPEGPNSAPWMGRGGFGQPFADNAMPPVSYNGAPVNAFRNDRMVQDPELLMAPPVGRRGAGGNGRFNNNRSSAASYPYASSNSSFDGYTPSSTPYGSVANLAGGVTPLVGPMGVGLNPALAMSGSMYGGYQPQPIGTPLSPMAPEFTSTTASRKGDVSYADN